MNTQTCLHSCHRHANFCLSMVNGWQESFHHRATPSNDEKMKKNFKKMKKNFKKLKKSCAKKLFRILRICFEMIISPLERGNLRNPNNLSKFAVANFIFAVAFFL